MLDSLFDQLKGQAITSLIGQTGVDADQASKALPLAKEAISEGIMGAATSGNFGGITDMFKMAAGGGSGVAGLAKNAVYAGIASKFLGKLTGSLGLGAGVAARVSAVALPMILGKIGGEVTKDGGSSMDLASVTKLLGGGAAEGASGALNQAAGMLGGLLGKR